MFCFGSGVSEPSACSSNSMKTRFQNSRKRSQSQPGAHSARPQPTSSPQSKNISESGPHGPGPPTDQKLSARGSRTIRSGGMPIASQARTATSSSPSPSSGSPAKTVTQIRSRSSFMCSNMNSQASSIAPSLKYWPNEKLPSISKKVSVRLFRPTSSMSGVRKTFCTVVSSGAGGSSQPEEERHQRLHPGRDQQRRAVVGARDQRGRGPELVALGLEELAEARAQLGGRSHGCDSTGGRGGDRPAQRQRYRPPAARGRPGGTRRGP